MLFLWLGVQDVNTTTHLIVQMDLVGVNTLIVGKWMSIIAATEKGRMTMADCKYYYDEFCVNDKCPLCADYCPVVDTENVCKWEERIEDNERSR